MHYFFTVLCTWKKDVTAKGLKLADLFNLNLLKENSFTQNKKTDLKSTYNYVFFDSHIVCRFRKNLKT
jgi:hypothetical protein